MPPPSPLLLVPPPPTMKMEQPDLPPRWADDDRHPLLLLPSPDDLIPLHQSLITPDLALAFDIPTGTPPAGPSSAPPPPSQLDFDPPSDDQARTLKRPRLVWTPQLHKRFVDAVAHLGIKNAVPKTIMQLMSVDGLTRENVASHLQKYRLYLKRMQGISHGGAVVPRADAATEKLFATVPVPYAPFLQQQQQQQYYQRHVGCIGSSPPAGFHYAFAGRRVVGEATPPAETTEKKVLTLFPTGDY